MGMLQPEISRWGLGRLGAWLVSLRSRLLDSRLEWFECKSILIVGVRSAGPSCLINFIHANSTMASLSGGGIVCNFPVETILPLENALVCTACRQKTLPDTLCSL